MIDHLKQNFIPGKTVYKDIQTSLPPFLSPSLSLSLPPSHSSSLPPLDVEVSCYGYEGIDAVKTALKAGLAQSAEQLPLEIRLIALPQYIITATMLERMDGVAKLNTAIQVIRVYRGERLAVWNQVGGRVL